MHFKNKTEMAKYFDISRPTLDKRIESGEIVVEKVDKYFINTK